MDNFDLLFGSPDDWPTSGERTLSTSTSKRSLSAPAGSSEESRSSSLPSVRRVSPQRSQVPLSGCTPLDYTTPQNDLNRSELGRANSEAIEVGEFKSFHRLSLSDRHKGY
ncbi:unnamed protein product [Hydatigera taeniaeformis]|uniref:AGC-kinase C-terminal domain-containing protein n=1 Tax=Hydatigena taeniaeformis TaxID=6205 RepID=A0A0R3WW09_HYDTA|nr:unnamed protein product [Hydatigera taeniaeformis]